MASNLFTSMPPTNNLGGMGNIVQQFQQFRKAFRGDPREQVQAMLNSGQITQEQYNRAVQMANQLQQMIGKV